MNYLIKTRKLTCLSHAMKLLGSVLPLRNYVHIATRKSSSHQSVYLVDESKNDHELSPISNLNKYTTRTATCGELTKDNLGQRVTLTGWLEFNRMDKFIILRDSYGRTQLMLRDTAHDLKRMIKDLNYETVLEVKGTVIARPAETVNKKQETGEIEIDVEDIRVVNEAATLPFNIREYQKANEGLQMQYRYLSMRFSEMQQNLRFRSEFSLSLREFLAKKCGFVEVETPTLFKATPGGAQEFVVPTRHKDKFYSLVQSPQQFKQMLMCGGIDRYFQIARCYRDETSRPDRQPEFTQLDIEMANTTVDGVMQLVEDLLQYAWPPGLSPLSRTFPRMSYNDAIENYGCDKPDIRFEHTIINCTEVLAPSLNLYGQGDAFYAGCIVFDESKRDFRLGKEANVNAAQDYPNTRMVHFNCDNYESFRDGLKKLVKNEGDVEKFYAELTLKGRNSIVLVYGNKNRSLKRLGKLRTLVAEDLHKRGVDVYKAGTHFVWIVDFPLFSIDDDGELSAEHHPFTTPHLDDVSLLDADPLKARALSYDLVLNGYEVGGGSMRIHDAKLQAKMLKMLNINGLDHIVEMLSCGCPPHGGVALGLDRLFAKVLNTPSIRDVIAFPKTFDGKDPVSGAPSAISDECRKIYHL